MEAVFENEFYYLSFFMLRIETTTSKNSDELRAIEKAYVVPLDKLFLLVILT